MNIYTTLQQRARDLPSTHDSVSRILTSIADGTYLRLPHEMQQTEQWWKLQAAEMLAREARDKLAAAILKAKEAVAHATPEV